MVNTGFPSFFRAPQTHFFLKFSTHFYSGADFIISPLMRTLH
jgi:hypothetical protein